MRKLYLGFLLITVLAPLRQALGLPCSATNRENCLYVSTFTDSRIYLLDTGTSAATLIHNGAAATVREIPGALVEGPDKLLYYSDTSTCRILRLNPFAPLGSQGANSTLETVLAGDSICPAGLTFDVDGHLYANTQPFSGVYKVARVQGSTVIPVSKIPLGQLAGGASAINVIPASATSSTGGAGVVFSNAGDLLFVGQHPGQVLFSSAVSGPFNSTRSLISGLASPIGIVQDNASKIFVTDHSTKNIIRCEPGGGSCSQFATFVDPADRPAYVDTDSQGRIFVATKQVTNGTHANGKIWRLTGPGSCPGSNCGIVGMIPQVGEHIGPAHGISLSATSAIRSATFGPGPDGIFGTPDDIKSQIFDFGTSFFGLRYPNGVLTTHTVTVRAQEVFPGDLTFASSATECNTYHGKKGKCVVYDLIHFIPTKNVDYRDRYAAYIKYSGQIPDQPAVLHDSRALPNILMPGGPDFPNNIFNRFDLGPPGVDPGTGGESADEFTAYVSADLGLPSESSTSSFLPPINSSQITVIRQGHMLPVRLSVRNGEGQFVTSAILRLGAAQIVAHSLFPDEVSSTINHANLFRTQDNAYLYDLITDHLPVGLHVLTVITDKDSPFKTRAVIALIEVTP